MRNLPSDMLALAAEIPPPEEWIIACLKMPSGDVWLSDRPVSAALLALLPIGVDPLPIVEDWGTLDDGQGIDKILAAGTSGYLCAPKTRIVLIRADQTKSDVDSIISQGIHNKRIELYRWFTGMTSAPVLIDTLFCQDRIELSESSMLFSFDAVGALASENPYMTDRENGQKNWPYLIGKAEGVPLELLEEESSKWTVLLGDQDGNEIDEEYTGLIRVDDATKLGAGQHLVNGEEMILAKASAGYMEITARARGGTEAQDHSNGSRIFPLNAVFKYAVCAGSIGSFEKLRTSNEIDIYDEDGDFDTTEYRDLYSGGNEEYHSELNPAQIWFNDRMPWLKKDQDYEITDKDFYGTFAFFSAATDCRYPLDINKKDGKPRLFVSFRRFSEPAADYWYKDTTIPIPSFAGEGAGATTYAASDTLTDGSGYFSVNQSFGEYVDNISSTAWREFRINSTCPPGQEAWTMIEPIFPDATEYVFTETGNYWAIVFQRVVTNRMDIRIDIYEVQPSGAELPIHSETRLGGLTGHHEWYPTGYTKSQPFIDINAYSRNVRIKFKLTCLNNNDPNSYAFVRIGGKSQYSETLHYGMAAFWRYYDSAPSSYLTSRFGKDLTSKGVFVGAKVRIRGVLRNSENKAEGTLKIYDNGAEKYSTSITDGDELDQEITLDASSWIELQNTDIKVEVSLDYALIYNYETSTVSGIPRTDGYAGVDFDGGIQWLISYTSDNLDGIQVNYTDTLYVDAISSRGADWTPAEALKWLSEDKTSWATDMLDLPAINARHAEYDAAGHYLNGLLSSERYQGAVKEIARQGFFLPIQDGGKVSLQNHLSWPSVVSISGDNDSLLEKSKTFEMTDTNSVVQRLVIDYNKNFSTGMFDGQYELDTGEHIEQMNSISLDLVNSDSAVILLATWLFNLKSIQLKCLGFDGNFRLISMQSWDKIELPDFLAGDLQAELIATGIQQQFAQPKNDRPSKFIIKTIKV